MRILTRPFRVSHTIILALASWFYLGIAGSVSPVAQAQEPEGTGTSVATVNGSTVLTFWYGKRQTFGLNGIPQKWVNILGNVSDPNGIVSMTYTLNGGAPITLSLGQDTRRLVGTGDFNIDIAYSTLAPLPDSNLVAVTVRNGAGVYTYDTVVVRYMQGAVWPRVFNLTWANSASLKDSAQAVDGRWSVVAEGLRILNTGYDRLVAIGDTTWRDFEITVPITIHSFDPAGYGSINGAPAVGLFFGWSGHSDDPISGWQPKTGYRPFACGAFYRFDTVGERLSIWDKIYDNSGKTIPYNTPYYFKVRVEWSGAGAVYSFKAWDVSNSEPAKYDLVWQSSPSDPQNGSVLLLAHFVDATFGAVSVKPIIGDHMPPVISDLSSSPGRTSAEVRWLTDELAWSRIDYGPTTAYGATQAHPDMNTEHVFTLTDLQANTKYHYRLTSFDEWGNTTVSADHDFTTTGYAAIVTDEFNAEPLDSALWTVQNPLGDAAVSVTGGNLQVSVPQNVEHTLTGGGNTMPRVVQTATDGDFEIEVKFAGALSQQVQSAGIDILQDAANYVQFELYSDGANVRAYAGVVVGNAGSSRSDVVVGANGAAPIYMRIKRERNAWTQSYSLDGSAWTTAGEFTQFLTVRNLGLATGNYGSPVPANTALFDYIHGTLPPVPRLTSPANGITGVGTTVTLAWSVSDGATGYDVQVGTDPAFVTGLIVNDSLLSVTSRQVNGLTAYTKYYWRVRSRNTVGRGPYCVSRWFTTFLPVPNQVVLVAPANHTETKADTIACVWRANNQPGTRYWFEISDDSLFAWPDMDSTITDTVSIRRGLEPGRTYYWRVKAGNLTGWGPYSQIRSFKRSLTAITAGDEMPREYALSQNYPNPFNPATVISYELPAGARVRLAVYDLLGREIALVSDEQMDAGYHHVEFRAEGLASGTYFYRLSVNEGEHVYVKRMTLIR